MNSGGQDHYHRDETRQCRVRGHTGRLSVELIRATTAFLILYYLHFLTCYKPPPFVSIHCSKHLPLYLPYSFSLLFFLFTFTPTWTPQFYKEAKPAIKNSVPDRLSCHHPECRKTLLSIWLEDKRLQQEVIFSYLAQQSSNRAVWLFSFLTR